MATSESTVLTPAAWAEQMLSALVESTTQDAFNTAFNAFISPDAQITLNGGPLTVEAFKAVYGPEKVGETHATTSYPAAVEIISDVNNLGASGGVVGFIGNGIIYDVSSGTQTIHTVNTSMHLVITSDGVNPTSRRVTAVNEVVSMSSSAPTSTAT